MGNSLKSGLLTATLRLRTTDATSAAVSDRANVAFEANQKEQTLSLLLDRMSKTEDDIDKQEEKAGHDPLLPTERLQRLRAVLAANKIKYEKITTPLGIAEMREEAEENEAGHLTVDQGEWV
jgi:hypothetical protein